MVEVIGQQQRRHAMTLEGMADVDANRVVDQVAIDTWVDGLETPYSRKGRRAAYLIKSAGVVGSLITASIAFQRASWLAPARSTWARTISWPRL